jgi:hypothetical protein
MWWHGPRKNIFQVIDNFLFYQISNFIITHAYDFLIDIVIVLTHQGRRMSAPSKS